MTVSVMIVEDHQATLDGLTHGLSQEPDLSIVGTSTNSDEAIEMADRLRPDIILLDLHVPGQRGPRSMIEEFLCFPTCKLVVFSAENRIAYVQTVMAMGVSAYLLKSERLSTVAETIKAVAAGKKSVLSSELSSETTRFTRSEHEVLNMLGRGMKYQEIADNRSTSIATVRKQCETILLKLGLETREQLIAWAVTNGYGAIET